MRPGDHGQDDAEEGEDDRGDQERDREAPPSRSRYIMIIPDRARGSLRRSLSIPPRGPVCAASPPRATELAPRMVPSRPISACASDTGPPWPAPGTPLVRRLAWIMPALFVVFVAGVVGYRS